MRNIRFVSNTVQHTRLHMHNSLPPLPISFSGSWSVQQKPTNQIQDKAFVIFRCRHKPLCCDRQPPNKPDFFSSKCVQFNQYPPNRPYSFSAKCVQFNQYPPNKPYSFSSKCIQFNQYPPNKPYSFSPKCIQFNQYPPNKPYSFSSKNAFSLTDIHTTQPYYIFFKMHPISWTSSQQNPSGFFSKCIQFHWHPPTKTLLCFFAFFSLAPTHNI